MFRHVQCLQYRTCIYTALKRVSPNIFGHGPLGDPTYVSNGLGRDSCGGYQHHVSDCPPFSRYGEMVSTNSGSTVVGQIPYPGWPACIYLMTTSRAPFSSAEKHEALPTATEITWTRYLRRIRITCLTNTFLHSTQKEFDAVHNEQRWCSTYIIAQTNLSEEGTDPNFSHYHAHR